MVLRDGGSCDVRHPKEAGPTRPYVDGLPVEVVSLGHTPGTVRGQLKLLGQLGRWMRCEGLEPSELNTACVEAFLAARRAEGHRRVSTVRSFSVLLEYLTDEHVIRPDGAVSGNALDGLVAVYRD